MPFYEYECSACKFYVEVLQKISDAPLKKCPSCKKAALKKLVSAPVFRLKGSGWYETDFKSDQDKKRNLVGEDKDTSSDKADSKADNKADAKSDSKADSSKEKSTDAKAPAESKSTSKSSKTPTKKSSAPSKSKSKPAAKKK